jgi:hypothetical protein
MTVGLGTREGARETMKLARGILVSSAAAGAIVASMLVASDVRAGTVNAPYAGCYKASDGSGYCYGSLLGFRDTAIYSEYATFESDYFAGGPAQSFSAYLNGNYYSCFAPRPGNAGAFEWPAGAASRLFSIFWNSAGQCTVLYTYDDSNYQTAN